MKRRTLTLVMGMILLMAFVVPSICGAGGFPTRPVQMISLVPPGAPAYTFSQIITQKMSKILGKKIVTSAQPGAGGVKAARAVLSKPADGYTLFDGWVSATVISVLERPDAGYTYKSFAPLGKVNNMPLTLIVRADSPWKTLPEFIEYAKKNPGMSYACGPDRSIPHALAATFFKQQGVKVRGIPYAGLGAGVKDFLGGTVDFAIGNFPIIKLYGKKIRTICVFQEERHPWYPDIPTAKEYGMDPGFGKSGAGWNAFYVKAGTPPDRLEKLRSAFKQVLTSEDFLAQAKKLGYTIDYTGPEGVYALCEKSMKDIKAGLENVVWEKKQLAK